jgi:hypothetical protein
VYDLGADPAKEGTMVFLGLSLLSLALAPSSSAQQWVQTAKIQPPTPFNYKQLGTSMAMEGSTLVASAPDDAAGTNRVYLFELDPSQANSWVLKKTFVGAASADVSGNTVAVREGGGINVYERDQGGPGAWGLSAVIQPGTTVGSISLDVDRLAVAGYQNGLFIFERDQGGPGQWGAAASIVVPSTSAGKVVALSGDLMVLGYEGYSYFGTEEPSFAYVYERQAATGTWLLRARLPKTPGAGDFGHAVAISGNLIAVGAPSYYPAGRGSVHLYRRPEKKWVLEKVLLGTYGQSFGYSVALEGSRLVAGCYTPFGPDDCTRTNRRTTLGGWWRSPVIVSQSVTPTPPMVAASSCSSRTRRLSR